MTSSAVPIVEIDGRYLFKGGERFIARGIVYRPRGLFKKKRTRSRADPLDDNGYVRLLQDVEAFKELRVNAIWVHTHDPDVQHDECMDLLAMNGIYVIFSLSSPVIAIDRAHPQQSYNDTLLNRYNKIIDSVSQYRNTLGVSVADQLVTQGNLSRFNNMNLVWDVIGRTIRDLKQYMRFKNFDLGQRMIPLCVNDGQWASLHSQSFEYLCNAEPTLDAVRPAGGKPDFYCFIHYLRDWDPHQPSNIGVRMREDEQRVLRDRHLDQLETSEIAVSHHNQIEYRGFWASQLPMQKFADADDPIPVLISEYGSTRQRPRYFEEVRQLYGKNMDSFLLHTLSGGFVYEFFEDANQYGLVKIEHDGSLNKMLDYLNLRDRMNWATGHDMEGNPIEDTTAEGENNSSDWD